jgi:formamidopyrimidine-DNA glycosylase
VPELPDVSAYICALEDRILGKTLQNVTIASVSLLRSVEPPISSAEGRVVQRLRRIGKRIAIGLDGDIWLVLHLMIAGRLHWRPPGTKLSGRNQLAAFAFADGTLLLTEAGKKRRAQLTIVQGAQQLDALGAGGIDVFAAGLTAFREALLAENHTLKRALTDPHIIDGIGNAYSDEILHAAKLSPIALTKKLTAGEWQQLYDATQATLKRWIERLCDEARQTFPEKVTAFRPEMAVHGRFGKPCPQCGKPIQRIRYADNETNYCAQCQTGGVILADRGLSRLLGRDWPRSFEELEERRRTAPGR